MSLLIDVYDSLMYKMCLHTYLGHFIVLATSKKEFSEA